MLAFSESVSVVSLSDAVSLEEASGRDVPVTLVPIDESEGHAERFGLDYEASPGDLLTLRVSAASTLRGSGLWRETVVRYAHDRVAATRPRVEETVPAMAVQGSETDVAVHGEGFDVLGNLRA